MRLLAARTIDSEQDAACMMSMQSAKPLPTLALAQGSASSSLLDPFFLLLSPRPRYSSSSFALPSYSPPSN